jgi:hypothetical protein
MDFCSKAVNRRVASSNLARGAILHFSLAGTSDRMRVTAYVLVLGVFRDVPKRIPVAGWVRLETDNEFEATIGPRGKSGTTEGGF